MATTSLKSLTIEDMSDREFLLVVVDQLQADGWADSFDVSKALGFDKRRFAATRLSWLSRFGAVEREHERDEAGNIRYAKDGKIRHTQRWRLTEVGEALAYGTLGKRQTEQLSKFDDDQMLYVTQWLTARARQANPVVTKLVAREWRYGSSSRRNGRVS